MSSSGRKLWILEWRSTWTVSGPCFQVRQAWRCADMCDSRRTDGRHCEHCGSLLASGQQGISGNRLGSRKGHFCPLCSRRMLVLNPTMPLCTTCTRRKYFLADFWEGTFRTLRAGLCSYSPSTSWQRGSRSERHYPEFYKRKAERKDNWCILSP